MILQWRPPLTPNGVIVLYSLKYNSTILVVTNTSSDVLMYTVGGLSSENVYVFQVTAHTGAGEGPPSSIVVVIRTLLAMHKCHHMSICSILCIINILKLSGVSLLMQGSGLSVAVCAS